jgi:hypothetical protein
MHLRPLYSAALCAFCLTLAVTTSAQTNGGHASGNGVDPFPEDAARAEAEVLGRFILAFSSQNPALLAPFLKNAETVTAFKGQRTDQTKKRFLEIWGEHKHRVASVETIRENGTIAVTMKEMGSLYTLTHNLRIRKDDGSIETIVMETAGDEKVAQKGEKTWQSKSLNEAESQLLATLSETTPTWKQGRATFEEGPSLESTAFGIQQPHENAVGVAVIVRNKTTGETAAGSTIVRSREDAVEAEEFRRLRNLVAEKMANDPIFRASN